jgi:hypothetical protein
MKTYHHRNIEELQSNQLNWKRVTAAIKKKYAISQEDAREIAEKLERVVRTGKLGFWSINRKNLINMAGSVIQNERGGCKIVSPICLNPEELATKPSGINSLVKRHIEFIENIRQVVKVSAITFLFPCHGTNLTSKEKEDALEVCQTTMSQIGGELYQAMPMHEFFPNSERSEEEILSKLDAIPTISKKLIEQIGFEREGIYNKQGIPRQKRNNLTKIGIAEFMNFGIMAAESNALICIHTTGRSRIFRIAGAGILHNPISL